MKLRVFICTFCFVFYFGQIFAQEFSDNKPETKSGIKELNLSVFSGITFLGPKNDLENQMKASGLGDAMHVLGTTNHPFSRNHFIFDVEASGYLTDRSGISLNFGLANNVQVHGYQEIGIGNILTLNSKTYSISACYIYRPQNKRHHFFIGPSLLIHSIYGEGAGLQSPSSKDVKLGIYTGYSYNIIERKYWFATFKFNYRWAPKSTVGSFVVEQHLGLDPLNPVTFRSEFLPTKVSLENIDIGISIGFKINK